MHFTVLSILQFKTALFVFLNDAVFSYNLGATLYLLNQNLHVVGSVLFDNNKAEFGAGIFVSNHSTLIFSEKSNVTFNQNTANYSGGAFLLSHFSNAIFEANSVVTFSNNTADQHCGGSIYSYENSDIIIKGNSAVQFIKNVAKFGGALCIKENSTFKVVNNSLVTFISNEADCGGAIYFTSNSIVEFAKKKSFTVYHTIATFIDNKAIQGGAIFINIESIIRFKESSLVTFLNNRAKDNGGALNCRNSSSIVFEKKSHTMFGNNKAEFGGAVYLENNATVVYKGNSLIEFIGNYAKQNGGALFSVKSKGKFQENSTVNFMDNTGEGNGGAACFSSNSNITFEEYSTNIITFYNNNAIQGGAIYTESSTNIQIGSQSNILFTNNNAILGGAIFCYNKTIITTKGNSFIKFAKNTALNQGGALVIKQNSIMTLKGNSNVTFHSNKAIHNGGSVLLEFNSKLQYEEHCTVTFNGNRATDGTGAAISSSANSVVKFKESSTVMFFDNSALQGGAIYSLFNSSLIFSNSTAVTFSDNIAAFGGALNFYGYSHIFFKGDVNCTIIFNNNKATQNGGAIYLQTHSGVIFQGSLTVKFHNNEATLGGAINCNSHSDITYKENVNVTFSHNNAKLGGGIYMVTSNITVADKSVLKFTYNTALQDGGAIFLDKEFTIVITGDADITFSFNMASDYGGAIYSRVDQSVINFNLINIYFDNNHARTAGRSIFINVPTLCNSGCLQNSVLVSKSSLQQNNFNKHITTSPKQLVLYKPAKCIDNSDVACDSYYIENIMLGQEILINACMYDYYGRPTGTAEFFINSTDIQDYYISGSQYILISCNHTLKGISIITNKSIPVLPFNYSITIDLYVVRASEMKTISLNMIVELSPCHPGFWYSDTSRKCECYNFTGIVVCSGSDSTIKRGYWFGSVSAKATVTFCPINYCNFTCCETTNGYYHLSPVRDNQCMSHRCGTACGSCEVGYTLSFDSTECIHVKECTVKLAILLGTLIILYWVFTVVVVFVMAYFKVEIGYLYGITYYYSIVDILLGQNWLLSNKNLYTFITVISSITKITPQFLWHFCLVQNMSGIDQQLVHYMHPLAITFILITITCLARRSRRLSSFISRGVIPFICFLLLLSYTSVATTSLLLIRPLIFHNVDKIFTYLSPDIEYFHGRHLVYGIAAVLVTIVIVIGLPFLLLLEPFLNRKINFVRIKPLLDQFQGCYRDRFRGFAGYYMICRLVIIVIIIFNSPNDFTAHYLIFIICVLINLLHQFSRPYADNYLNLFDGTILHQTILVSFLPLVEFFDTFNSDMFTGMIYVLVLLPIVSLTTMKLLIHREKIKRAITYCGTLKCKHSRKDNENIPLNDCQTQLLKEVGVTVDDNMRKNALIVEV